MVRFTAIILFAFNLFHLYLRSGNMSPTVKKNRSIETNLEMKEVGISRQNLLNSYYNYVQGFTGNDRKDGESQ